MNIVALASDVEVQCGGKVDYPGVAEAPPVHIGVQGAGVLVYVQNAGHYQNGSRRRTSLVRVYGQRMYKTWST